MGSDALGVGPRVSLPPEPADAPVDLVEVTGAVKWFDAGKGYGFIVPDGGGADVLVHVTCLRRDGFSTATEGARIVCEAARRAKGLQAVRVISLDMSTATYPPAAPVRVRESVSPHGDFEPAVVKWFNRMRGFGFLSQGAHAPDIFVHMETLRQHGLGELRPGQTVLVRYGDSPKGLMATEVKAGEEQADEGQAGQEHSDAEASGEERADADHATEPPPDHT